MADPQNIEQSIEKNIRIFLEQEGAQDVANGMRAVREQVLKVRNAAKELGGQVSDLNLEIQAQAKAYVRNEKAAATALKSTQKKVKDTIKSFGDLGGAVSGAFGEIKSGLKGLAGLGGFGGMVTEAVSYDKVLLSLSSQTARLGIGITALEKKMVGISRSMTLTKKETMSLFASFEKGFAMVSVSDFESLLERIQHMVGSNKEEIEKYSSAVGGLQQKFFGLARGIAQLGKDATESDKKAYASKLQMLYVMGEISEAEYRNNMAVVKGNKQESEGDRKRAAKAKDRIDALQEFKQQVEDIKLGLGRTILPALIKIADWLDRLTQGGERWGRGLMAAAAALATLNLAKGGLGKLGGMAVSGLMGGGGGGAAGAALSSSSTALSGFSAALGKSTAVIGAAIIGWQLGKVAYKNMIEPWMEKKYEEGAHKDTWTRKILLAIGGGANKDPNVEKSKAIREKNAPRYAKIQKDREAAELKVAQALERQVEADAKAAELEQQRLIYTKQMGTFAKEIGILKDAESGLLNTQLERMKLTGKVDEASLGKGKAKVFASIDAEVAATRAYIDALKKLQTSQKSGDTQGKTVQQMAKLLGLSDSVVDTFKSLNIERVEDIKFQAKIAIGEAKIASKTKERQAVVEALNTAYSAQISLQGTLADKASLLVQIADSYAIGIGASAQMRMQEFNAIENQRKEMEKQLRIQQSQLAAMGEGDARLKQTEIVAKTENEILQLQLKQAGITKSLRDGWIEAIGSMNTGAGTFTKIIMDQNKGTAQSLKLAGQAAVVSSRSGSMAAGFRTSERFSAMQGVAGQSLITGSMGKRMTPYEMTMDRLTGSSAQGLQWRGRAAASRSLAARNKYAASGGFKGSAFGASPLYEGVVGEYGAGRDAPVTDGTTGEFDTSPQRTKARAQNRAEAVVAQKEAKAKAKKDKTEGFTGEKAGGDIALAYTNGAVNVFVTNLGKGAMKAITGTDATAAEKKIEETKKKIEDEEKAKVSKTTKATSKEDMLASFMDILSDENVEKQKKIVTSDMAKKRKQEQKQKAEINAKIAKKELDAQLALEHRAKLTDPRSGKEIARENVAAKRAGYKARRGGHMSAAKRMVGIEDKITKLREEEQTPENLAKINKLKKVREAMSPEQYQADASAYRQSRGEARSRAEARRGGERPTREPVKANTYGDPTSLSAIAEPTASNGVMGTINVNVKFSGGDEVAGKIAKAIGPEVNRMINEGAANSLNSVRLA